jgi:hypothetical protein
MESGEQTWRRPPLVSAVHELRWFGRTWSALAGVALAGELVSGAVFELSRFDVWASALLFGLTVLATLARLFLGLRTQPDMEYAQIFERSAPPPAGFALEPVRRTASRAVWVAVAVGALLAVGAGGALVVMLGLIGKPREQVLDDIAGAAFLVGAGWTIVCAAAAFRIAAWFSRWEVRRGRVVLCRPLSSGRLAYVYHVADAAPEES